MFSLNEKKRSCRNFPPSYACHSLEVHTSIYVLTKSKSDCINMKLRLRLRRRRRRRRRRTHFRRCRWPYRRRWCHPIGVCGRCSDPERSRAWSRTPPEASQECGGRRRRCCRWRRWTPPAPPCLWPPKRRRSPSAKNFPEDQGEENVLCL